MPAKKLRQLLCARLSFFGDGVIASLQGGSPFLENVPTRLYQESGREPPLNLQLPFGHRPLNHDPPLSGLLPLLQVACHHCVVYFSLLGRDPAVGYKAPGEQYR